MSNPVRENMTNCCLNSFLSWWLCLEYFCSNMRHRHHLQQSIAKSFFVSLLKACSCYSFVSLTLSKALRAEVEKKCFVENEYHFTNDWLHRDMKALRDKSGSSTLKLFRVKSEGRIFQLITKRNWGCWNAFPFCQHFTIHIRTSALFRVLKQSMPFL